MCVNYRATDAEVLEAMTGLSTAGMAPWKEQIWQDYPAPIIRSGPDGGMELVLATYGMIPKDKVPGGFQLTTMNARAEARRQICPNLGPGLCHRAIKLLLSPPVEAVAGGLINPRE